MDSHCKLAQVTELHQRIPKIWGFHSENNMVTHRTVSSIPTQLLFQLEMLRTEEHHVVAQRYDKSALIG